MVLAAPRGKKWPRKWSRRLDHLLSAKKAPGCLEARRRGVPRCVLWEHCWSKRQVCAGPGMPLSFSLLLRLAVQFPQHHYWGDGPLPIVHSWYICHFLWFFLIFPPTSFCYLEIDRRVSLNIKEGLSWPLYLARIALVFSYPMSLGYACQLWLSYRWPLPSFSPQRWLYFIIKKK